MPHESTVDHEDVSPVDIAESPMAPRSRSIVETLIEPDLKRAKFMERQGSLVPNRRADTPKKITHHHDEDDSDDDSSDKSSS